MSTQPFTAGRFRAFDSNGKPLAGGLLYTYAAGTTTPLATYTTRAGSIANANPVVLNANGEADVWMTPGLLYKFVLQDSSGVLQWTEDNYPSTSEQTSSSDASPLNPGGRLTVVAGTPVPNGGASGSLIYYVPYLHDKVPLYDGTNWTLYSIGDSGLSQVAADNTKSPAAAAASSNYDMFIWNDSGILRLSRGPVWTNDASRGTGVGTTEIQQVNGRWVNKNAIANGPSALCGLYVGTVRTDGSVLFVDTLLKRNVWNCYNRVEKGLLVFETTVAWNAGTADVYRQVRGSSANQVEMVFGLIEDSVHLEATLVATGAGAGYTSTGIGIGNTGNQATVRFPANYGNVALAIFDRQPPLGLCLAIWLEIHSVTNDLGAIGSAFNNGSGNYSYCGMSGHMRG